MPFKLITQYPKKRLFGFFLSGVVCGSVKGEKKDRPVFECRADILYWNRKTLQFYFVSQKSKRYGNAEHVVFTFSGIFGRSLKHRR